MNINKTQNGNELTIALGGRLDTTTAPELEQEINNMEGNVTSLIIDMSDLEYVSSAGLRVLLSAQKKMNMKGSMVIRNVCDEIKEVFEITGFIDILTIE